MGPTAEEIHKQTSRAGIQAINKTEAKDGETRGMLGEEERGEMQLKKLCTTGQERLCLTVFLLQAIVSTEQIIYIIYI